MNRETFTKHFAGGMTATMIFTIEAGKLTDWRCFWSKKLKPRRLRPIFAAYTAWRNEAVLTVQTKYGLGGTLVVDLGAEPILTSLPAQGAAMATGTVGGHSRN